MTVHSVRWTSGESSSSTFSALSATDASRASGNGMSRFLKRSSALVSKAWIRPTVAAFDVFRWGYVHGAGEFGVYRISHHDTE